MEIRLCEKTLATKSLPASSNVKASEGLPFMLSGILFVFV